MTLVDTRRKEILASRWGLDAASLEEQAECAVMGHVFADFAPSPSDPLAQRKVIYDKCIYCGWKER